MPRIPLPALVAVSLMALAAPGLRPAGAAELQPVSAEYRVLRNGDALGTATMRLEPGASGDWQFSTQTRGSAGLAALLGLSVRTDSRFRLIGGQPESLDYHYALKSGIKDNSNSLSFDWTTHQARYQDRKGSQVFALDGRALDRNVATLALGMAVADGAHGTLVLPVALRDHISQQHYAIGARAPLQVPAGTYQAIKVERSDADNGIRAWYAPPLLLPVKFEQRDDKGDVTVMELARPPAG